MNFLTETEKSELKQLEEIIQNGLHTFIEIGTSLLRIRDAKLYRETHRTFESYCEDKFGMTIRHAQRLMISAKTVEEMRPIGRLPQKESQIRPLTHLEPEQKKEVWQKAVETAPEGKVTAAHVESVVQEVVHPESQKEIKEDSEALVQLKRWWKKANAKDRRGFLRTIENDAPKGFHIEYRHDEDPDFKKLMAEDKKSRRAALKRIRAGGFTEHVPEEESIIGDMRDVLSELDLTDWAKDELWNDDSLAGVEWRKPENENLFTVAWEREFDENYEVEH